MFLCPLQKYFSHTGKRKVDQERMSGFMKNPNSKDLTAQVGIFSRDFG